MDRQMANLQIERILIYRKKDAKSIWRQMADLYVDKQRANLLKDRWLL